MPWANLGQISKVLPSHLGHLHHAGSALRHLPGHSVTDSVGDLACVQMMATVATRSTSQALKQHCGEEAGF